MMRKRPTSKKDFIDNALGNITQEDTIKEDLHKYVRRTSWPIDENIVSPSMAEGSKLKKPMILPIKEYEWNSIERHTKLIGVPKAEWIRYAIYKLLQDEQFYFLKHKSEK